MPFSGAACFSQRALACAPALEEGPLRARGSTRPRRGSSCAMRSPSAAATFAMLRGSRWMCGLPAACTSPSERSRRCRHLEQRHHARRLEVARLAGLDLRVARLRLQQRQPADLELGAGAHHQVGAARPRDQARPRLDAVRILQRGGRDVDARLVAGELLRERAPLGLAREDVERRPRGKRNQQENNDQESISWWLLELVRAVRAEAVDVLQEHLVVGHALRATCPRANCSRKRLNSLGLKSSITVLRVGL